MQCFEDSSLPVYNYCAGTYPRPILASETHRQDVIIIIIIIIIIIPGKHSIDSLQKTVILGTSHIIRKVLQCEA